MGAYWGGLWGLFFGSATFAIPGLGPILVVGPLVAWIVAELEGAVVVGGVSAVGAGLASIGIPQCIRRSRGRSTKPARQASRSESQPANPLFYELLCERIRTTFSIPARYWHHSISWYSRFQSPVTLPSPGEHVEFGKGILEYYELN